MFILGEKRLPLPEVKLGPLAVISPKLPKIDISNLNLSHEITFQWQLDIENFLKEPGKKILYEDPTSKQLIGEPYVFIMDPAIPLQNN